MKKLSFRLILAVLAFAGTTPRAQAWEKVGAVFLDVNTNFVIDAHDLPVKGAVIIVTNFAGTFSNATVTAADGTFSLPLLDTPQSYEDFILPSSLPPGITEIRPRFNVFDTSASVTVVTNFFLLENVLHPPLLVGHVFCDADTNRMIDVGDLPVPGVLVAVTNFTGTFSNAAFTDVHGFFAVQLPQVVDLYGNFIVPSSLPAGSTVVIPPEFAVFQFSIPALPSNIVTNDYLIQNPDCASAVSMIKHSWLSGAGTIRTERSKGSKPEFSFGGVVFPLCKASARGGNWNVIDHANRLQFRALAVRVVQGGSLPGLTAAHKSALDYIDFQGVGTLKGLGSNRAHYNSVLFTARAMDLGKGTGGLYLRVDDPSGNTLLLISADPANPFQVAPRALSTGNLQTHLSHCSN